MSKRQIRFVVNDDAKKPKECHSFNKSSKLPCDFHLMYLLGVRAEECDRLYCERNHDLAVRMYNIIYQNNINEIYNNRGELHELLRTVNDLRTEVAVLRKEVAGLNFWHKSSMNQVQIKAYPESPIYHT